MKGGAIGSAAYVHSIGKALGEIRPLGEVPELQRDQAALETFLALGLENYSCSENTPSDMARTAIKETLAISRIDPSTIDTLVYASDTPPMGKYYGEELRELCFALDLTSAYPVGLFLSECGNAHLALRTAADLIQLGRAERILVVTADRCVDTFPRVWAGVTVLSDGACSFLVERERPGEGFEICATAHRTNPDLWKLDLSTQVLEYFKGVVENVRLVAEEALASCNLSSKDVRHVVVNNYNLSVIRTFVRQMGFRMPQAYTKNLPRFAHTFASDAFINLSDLTSEGSLDKDDYVLLVGSAMATWGASLVRRV